MKKVLVVALLFVLQGCDKPKNDTVIQKEKPKVVAADRLSPDGYDGLKIGMDAAAAAKILNTVLTDEPCQQVKFKDTLVMLENGHVERISLGASYGAKAVSEVKTAEGITLGDSEEKLKAAYPDAKIEPHKYEPSGKYYKTRSGDSGYVFEVLNGIVSKIHAGRYPAVEYVEGCS